jgi:acyl transferase domain-containing protein
MILLSATGMWLNIKDRVCMCPLISISAPSISIGEIAMGYASGHYNRETAIGIAVARATAMTLADRNGCMAALGVSVSKAKLMIEKVLSNANVSEGLWIAAVNSVNAVTVSGHEYLIDAIVALAATPTDKVFAAKLRVTCAFHSPLMETQEATFRSSMKNSALVNGTGSSPSSPTTARVMSSVDGNWLQRDLDADYCWDNIRRPVLFGAGINRIVNHCKLSNQKVIFLEIAPHPVLRSYIEEEGGGMPTISLVTRPNPKVSVKATGNHQQFLEGLGSLIGAGYKGVDFDRFYATPHGHQGYVKINFPLYPYNKTICWSESGAARSIRLQQPTKPLSGSHFRLSVDTHPELAAHHIFNTPLFPASG